MKNLLIKTILCASLAAGLTACTLQESNDDKSGEKARIEVSAAMDASELSEAGEQLMGPYTWMLADKVFAMALEKNPMDKKAQFYKALLKPMMVYRGIATRMKPFAREHGSISNLEKSIQDFPDSPMKTFLLEGKEDITTGKQIQDLVVQQREAFNDFRKFLKENSDLEMTVNLNPYVWEEAIAEKLRENCKVVEDHKEGFVVVCDSKDIATTKIGSADTVAAAQMMAGYVLFYDIYTSYSIEGIEKVYKQLQNPSLTPLQRQKVLESVPTLGKLRPDQTLSRVLELGSDFSAAAKWALKYQDRLCALGEENKENRPGYVLNKGVCITETDEVKRNLILLEQGLRGAITLSLPDKQGPIDEKSETTLDVFKFVTQPTQDLRSLAPSSYCEHTGEAKTLRDPTLNGLYPKGDAEKFTLQPCW